MVGELVGTAGGLWRMAPAWKVSGCPPAESYAPGAVVSEVARQKDISPQRLFAWRKAARDGLLSSPADEALMFVPVVTEFRHDETMAAASAGGATAIMIEIGGAVVRAARLYAGGARGRLRRPAVHPLFSAKNHNYEARFPEPLPLDGLPARRMATVSERRPIAPETL
jgi:transposase